MIHRKVVHMLSIGKLNEYRDQFMSKCEHTGELIVELRKRRNDSDMSRKCTIELWITKILELKSDVMYLSHAKGRLHQWASLHLWRSFRLEKECRSVEVDQVIRAAVTTRRICSREV